MSIDITDPWTTSTTVFKNYSRQKQLWPGATTHSNCISNEIAKSQIAVLASMLQRSDRLNAHGKL